MQKDIRRKKEMNLRKHNNVDYIIILLLICYYEQCRYIKNEITKMDNNKTKRL